jgi:hypothetical protein
MTATPHNGKEEDVQLFLSLLIIMHTSAYVFVMQPAGLPAPPILNNMSTVTGDNDSQQRMPTLKSLPAGRAISHSCEHW